MNIALVDRNGEVMGSSQVPDSRSFPRAVTTDGKRIFLRRGESVGSNSSTFDEIEVVQVKEPAK